MLFENFEERVEYFSKLASGEIKPDCGTAMEFAMETNLGIWGEESEMFINDVATIFAAELKSHFPDQLRHAIGFLNIKPEEVSETEAFKSLLRLARKPRQADIHNGVRSLGTNSSHMQPIDGSLCEHDIKELTNAHHLVLANIHNKY